MTLEEYVTQTRIALDDFALSWDEANKVNPGNYPDKMSQSDWNDHFYFSNSVKIYKAQQPKPHEQ